MNRNPNLQCTVRAHSAAEDSASLVLQSLSEQERSQMLAAACAAAMEIERSRIAAGMPPTQPAPWPASTWEFLRTSAANARR